MNRPTFLPGGAYPASVDRFEVFLPTRANVLGCFCKPLYTRGFDSDRWVSEMRSVKTGEREPRVL